jgi:VanZ family protein
LSNQTEFRTSPWVICGRIFFTFCLAATIWFIFSNSRQIADVSEGRSQEALTAVQAVFNRVGMTGIANSLTDHIIRKLGHFCEYMLEGFWLMLCLRVYTRHFVKHISWPILGGLLTALCDETIQLFTAGRSGQVSDVWIDFSGVMAGLFVGFLIRCLFRMFTILFQHRNEE